MGKEKAYATWPQVIFTEIVMVFVIAFMAVEFKATQSLEALKALVLVSAIGFFTSLFLILSAMEKFPIMILER